MKKTRLSLIAILSLSLVTALLMFTACNGGGSDGAVAATVNGTKIMEQDVTADIENTRARVDALDDATWAQALASSGFTPESLRESVINRMAQVIIIAQEAEAQGFTTDEAAIDEQVAQTRITAGAEDDAAWLEMLNMYGFSDEQAYRDMLINNDLQNKLYDSFELSPTDEELRTFIAEHPDLVEGFLTPDSESASATAVAAETPDVADTEDADAIEGEDTDAVETEENLEPDNTSDADNAYAPDVPVLSPEDVDLNAISDDILAKFKDLWVQYNKGIAFQKWIQELIDNADIVINDMPADVSYNVDMSLADTSTNSFDDNTDNSSPVDYSSPEAVDAALAQGLVITDDVVGDGTEATPGSIVRVHYTGTLEDGTIFDSNTGDDRPFEFTLGGGHVIQGWDAGVVGMKVGGKRLLTIPASLGYGPQGNGPIPPNATLFFEVELVEVVQ